MKLMKINVNTITIGLIIAGMILSSLLQVKAFIPTNNTAACAAAAAALAVNVSASASQAMANEEREQEQLNKLLNERIKQGKTIAITADKDVKLLIKQGKMADITVNNKKPSLKECVYDAIVFFIVCCLMCLFMTTIDKLGQSTNSWKFSGVIVC